MKTKNDPYVKNFPTVQDVCPECAGSGLVETPHGDVDCFACPNTGWGSSSGRITRAMNQGERATYLLSRLGTFDAT